MKLQKVFGQIYFLTPSLSGCEIFLINNNENFRNFLAKIRITILEDLVFDYEPNFHLNSKLEIYNRKENKKLKFKT